MVKPASSSQHKVGNACTSTHILTRLLRRQHPQPATLNGPARRAMLAVGMSFAAIGASSPPSSSDVMTTRPVVQSDWSTPGLAKIPDPAMPLFEREGTGLKVQRFAEGNGAEAQLGDRVEIDYVLRRSNGYFIYSTVEGVSFQPLDVPVGPYIFQLGDPTVIQGLTMALLGQKGGSKFRLVVPASLGYVKEGLEPQPPLYAQKRQVLMHSREDLLFEVKVIKVFPQL